MCWLLGWGFCFQGQKQGRQGNTVVVELGVCQQVGVVVPGVRASGAWWPGGARRPGVLRSPCARRGGSVAT